MTEARDIHIHLTPQPGTTVRVTVVGDDITVVSDSAEPNANVADMAASPDGVLEAAIDRLASSGASPHVREAANGLLELEYDLRPAKTIVPGKVPEN